MVDGGLGTEAGVGGVGQRATPTGIKWWHACGALAPMRIYTMDSGSLGLWEKDVCMCCADIAMRQRLNERSGL